MLYGKIFEFPKKFLVVIGVYIYPTSQPFPKIINYLYIFPFIV